MALQQNTTLIKIKLTLAIALDDSLAFKNEISAVIITI